MCRWRKKHTKEVRGERKGELFLFTQTERTCERVSPQISETPHPAGTRPSAGHTHARACSTARRHTRYADGQPREVDTLARSLSSLLRAPSAPSIICVRLLQRRRSCVHVCGEQRLPLARKTRERSREVRPRGSLWGGRKCGGPHLPFNPCDFRDVLLTEGELLSHTLFLLSLLGHLQTRETERGERGWKKKENKKKV